MNFPANSLLLSQTSQSMTPLFSDVGYGGSDDEVTECYVEDTSPLINSPRAATMGNRTRRQKSVRKDSCSRYPSPGISPRVEKPKEKRRIIEESDNSNRRSSHRARQHEHVFQMSIENTPQVSQLLVHFSDHYWAFTLKPGRAFLPKIKFKFGYCDIVFIFPFNNQFFI